MLIKNVRLILVMLGAVLVYGRVCIAETWKMMKVTMDKANLSWILKVAA